MLRAALLAAAASAALPVPGAVAAPLGIGCNVAGLSYYDGDLKTCDILHEGSAFGVPGGPWQGAVALDAAGWPLADFSVILVDNQQGRFSELWRVRGVTANASALPAISGVACAIAVLNITRDAGGGGFFTAYVASTNQTMITLSFEGTGGGIRNLSIWRTACDSTPAATFHPAYVAHVSRCAVLRFLDFAAINDNNVSTWAAATPASWPQWTGAGRATPGAPWAAAIALANDAQTDVWVQIPALADDDYITQLAALLLERLHRNATIYTEYANEVWNFQFAQARWAVAAANASVLAGDPLRLDFDGCGNVYYWGSRLVAYTAAVRIPALFAAVFGAAAVGFGARVRPVLAGQVAYTEPLAVGIDYLVAVHGPLRSGKLHAFAGAPYFGASTANRTTVDALLAAVGADVDAMAPGAGWCRDAGLQQTATLAAWHRVFLRGYEGGPDFSGGGNNYTLSGAAQRDAGFTAVMQRYFLNWAQYGTNEAINQYTAGASNWSEQYGCWGLVEDIAAHTSTKLAAFDAARAAPRPQNQLGVPVPASDFPGGYFSGCSAANQSSAGSAGLHNGTIILYPVNLAGLAPTQKTIDVAINGTAGPGVLVEVGLNGGRFVNTTIPGVVSFALTADDVGGDFGGASALRMRGVTPGAYLTISTLGIILP